MTLRTIPLLATKRIPLVLHPRYSARGFLTISLLLISITSAPHPLVRGQTEVGTGGDTGSVDEGITALVELLGQIDDTAFQRDLLQGVEEGLRGRRRVTMPAGWESLYRDTLSKSTDESVRRRSLRLSLVFGDKGAIRSLRNTVLDSQADPTDRLESLNALHEARISGLLPVLLRLTHDAVMRRDAIAALAVHNDNRIPATLLGLYDELSVDERRVALDTLAARKAFAAELLQAVANGQVPAAALSAETIRKLRLLRDPALDEQISEYWGSARTTPEEIAKQIAVYKAELTDEDAPLGEPHYGHAVFARTCQQCHKLFGRGGDVGPDITGSHRANLDYLLTNVVDPNALIGKAYQAWNIFTTDGAVHIGLIVAENDSAITLRSATETIVIPQDEIEEREQSTVSMMPVGLFEQMTARARRDLVRYLASNQQCPLLVTAENIADHLRDATIENCVATGAGWNTEPMSRRLGGTFQPATSARTLATGMYLVEGELTLSLSSALQSGFVRFVLFSESPDTTEAGVSLTLLPDNRFILQAGDRAAVGDVDGQLKWRLDAQRTGATGDSSVELPLPDRFVGGEWRIVVSPDAAGEFACELTDLAAPPESSLALRAE